MDFPENIWCGHYFELSNTRTTSHRGIKLHYVAVETTLCEIQWEKKKLMQWIEIVQLFNKCTDGRPFNTAPESQNSLHFVILLFNIYIDIVFNCLLRDKGCAIVRRIKSKRVRLKFCSLSSSSVTLPLCSDSCVPMRRIFFPLFHIWIMNSQLCGPGSVAYSWCR